LGGFLDLSVIGSLGRAATTASSILLAGCTAYNPLPLPSGPDLVSAPAKLSVAHHEGDQIARLQKLDFKRPVSIDKIGILAVLNDPDLKSERGELGVAQAGVLQASLLPNPAATLDYGALISGPGIASSVGASLSQDIVAIVTRSSRVHSAKGQYAQVDAEQLWREWQVVQKARQLAVDIYWEERAADLTEHEQRLLKAEISQVRKAVSAGNLTLSALAPLLSADASAAQSLVSLRVSRLKDWQSLDGMLGLDPKVRFPIARPIPHRLPGNMEALVATLPTRRPDLLALQFGYGSAEQDVRAAVLQQFRSLTIGGSYGSDTSKVVTIGPSFGFELPIFNQNQGHIAKAEATRELLREKYQAQLDKSAGDARALAAQIKELSRSLGKAEHAADSAQSFVATARKAYERNDLDQRSLSDYETTALQRSIEVMDIKRQLDEDRVFLAVELGLNVPHRRIAFGATTES
jgi:outer membrane protein TolC